MTRTIRFATFLILLSSSFMSMSAGNAPSVNELSAIETVNSYLSALMAGNTSQARLLLAPRIADERRALFDNSNYPAQLQQAYANASYDVIGSKEINTEKVQVEVRVMLNQQDTVHSQFVLTKINNQFLISSDQ